MAAMPDWTYQTIFRPVLMRLVSESRRRLALSAMGRLARIPGGRRVIQLMGHMSADLRLRRRGWDLVAGSIRKASRQRRLRSLGLGSSKRDL